jgi:hypothetical protein
MPIIAGRASAAYGAGFGKVLGSAFAPVSAFDALSTVIVPSGGLTSITFAGIPQTGYSHLQVRVIARSTYNANPSSAVNMRLNGNSTSSSYSVHLLDGNGSGAPGPYGASSDFPQGSISNATAGGGIFGVNVFDILDYSSTSKNKTIRNLGGNDNNGSGAIRYGSGVFYDTSAINSITFVTGAGDFTEHSSFALYGVK